MFSKSGHRKPASRTDVGKQAPLLGVPGGQEVAQQGHAAAGEATPPLREGSPKTQGRQTSGTDSTQTPSSTLSESRSVELRYAKFSINGLAGDKHAVFIPDGAELNTAILTQICLALDWEVPSLLLSGVGSAAHPARLSTPELRASPGFAPLVDEARRSLGIGQEKDSSSAAPLETEQREKAMADVADRVLEKKLASAVNSVATAALRANAWVLSGPRISTFEVSLQQCFEHGETVPFRAVAAHMQDRAYAECGLSQALLAELFSSSQALRPDVEALALPVQLPGDLWDRATCASNGEYATHGIEYWSFDTLDQALAAEHPVAFWPWPHADLFLLFYHEATRNGTSVGVDWEYATEGKLEALPMALDALPPVGHVFFGAPGSQQLQAKRKFVQGVRHASPLVILDNTPGAGKQLSALANVMKKAWDPSPGIALEPFFEGAAPGPAAGASELLQALSPAKLMRHVEAEFDSSGMVAAERLTLSDVVGVLDMAGRRPEAFREVVCVLDPLQDSQEQALARLLPAFTSQHTGTKEPAVPETHRSLVLKAWCLYLQLARKAARLRALSVALAVAAALAVLVGITLAMLLVSRSLQGPRGLPEELLAVAVLSFPLFVGLLMAAPSVLQVDQKWGDVQLAASLVVSEIFHFLAAVEPYTSTPALNQRRLLQRLRQLVRRLSRAGVREDDAPSDGGAEDTALAKEVETLQEQVALFLYGVRPRSWWGKKANELLGALPLPLPAWAKPLLGRSRELWQQEGACSDGRDLVAPLTLEAYVLRRVGPLRKHYAERLNHLTRLRLALQCALLVCLSVCGALGALDVALWIPSCLAVAGLIESLARTLVPPGALAALQSSLVSLQSFELRWDCPGGGRAVGTPATKLRSVALAEGRAVAVAAAMCRTAPQPEADAEDCDGSGAEEPPAPRAGAARHEQRSRPISVACSPHAGRSGVSTPTSCRLAAQGR